VSTKENQNSDSNIKTIYLIDGTAYIYRAYHAIRNLSNSKGFPTNAIFGFTRMLMKLIQDKNPEFIVMFFDAKGPTFRHELYTKYKANRPPMPQDLVDQLPHIKSVTNGFNIHYIEQKGYEADDLIGTCARLSEKEEFNVIMVTGDKDFVQLVSDQSSIFDPMKDKITTLETVNTSFGLSPHQVIDVMGLSGDTADNVPGVPGIGPKTGISLIKTFGSMENLYDNIDQIKKKKKQHENLVTFKDQAFLSKELVTIQRKVPIEFNPLDFKSKAPNNEELLNLYKELEFRQLQKEVSGNKETPQKKYLSVLNEKDLSQLIGELKKSGIFSVDTETTSKDPMKALLVGLSFSIHENEAFYIPCAHHYLGAPDQLNLAMVLDKLKPILEDPSIKKIGQNIKYDQMVLHRHGIHLQGITFDTMLASYLINPSNRGHSLDQIALDYLSHKTISYEEVAGKGKKAICFSQVPVEQAVPYACEDADITLMAKNVLEKKLAKAELTSLFETVEMPLLPVLSKMELTGVCVDRDELIHLSKSFEQQLDTIESEIYALSGEKFNIRSSQQLGHILFEKLNLPVQKKTRKKTGYSTDVNVLTALTEYHELPVLILRHRTLSKLKSTYSDSLLDLIHPKTNRIHTSYNQTVAVTGRSSSSNPNLQNIPIRTEEGRQIRGAFVPQKEWVLMAADYSQIELRILAHCADDPILIEAFEKDEDIHTRTATEIFQVFPSFITGELRRQAKAINFGIIYGMSAYGLSKQLDISNKMAQTYINNYFSRYKGVKKFIDQTIESARETRQTKTLLGRVRHLPDINSSNRNVRQFAERSAINTPIQGTAADLIKLAMIRMDKALIESNFNSQMLLTVHDEIVFEVPKSEVAPVKRLVEEVMESVWALKVPLKVNISTGNNWAEAH